MRFNKEWNIVLQLIARKRDCNSQVKPPLSSVSHLPDYTVHTLTLKQFVGAVSVGGLLLMGVGYIFFHSIWLSLILSIGAYKVPKLISKYLLERRRNAISLQFKQALYSISSSLAAGRSVENAFLNAIEDLRLLYPGGDNDFIKELSIICTKMQYGQPIEEALQDFSRRADNEEITNFAEVFTTCKRSGGDLVEIVRRTSSIITEKLEISQEIGVMIAQKRFEARAMICAPFAFLIFMNVSSPDYMTPMHSGVGIILSAISLIILGLCSWWMLKIMDIKL
jgi:tight adherence protein B